MKYCEELIDSCGFEDKERLLEVSQFILKDMDSVGIRYINDNFERVADNHIIELSVRILNNSLIQDAEIPFDRDQVTDEAWEKVQKIKEDLKNKYGTVLTDIETFLIATHFMLNA